MKRLIVILSLLGVVGGAFAGEVDFTKFTKASLVFREEADEAAHYPHQILVYLRIENQHDSDLTWLCDRVSDIEAEVVDAAGQPVPRPSGAMSIPSQYSIYALSYRSRLDWFISSGGISMAGDFKSNAALLVGSKGWLLPRASLASYSLKIRVRGTPFPSSETARNSKLLFDVPATPIKIEK